MKIILFTFLFLCALTPCNKVFGQKNQISIVTGTFHSFFDGTPIANSEKMTDPSLRNPFYLFGGYLNDSWGINYQRKIAAKSFITLEYSMYQGQYIAPFSEWSGGPRIEFRRLNYINCHYTRECKIGDLFKFQYGVGLNYQWGFESYRLSSPPYPDDLVEKYFFRGDRHAVSFHARTGLEYCPSTLISILTYIDFMGAIYVKSVNLEGVETADFFKEKFNAIQFPSRSDLSLNFGVGFRF